MRSPILTAAVLAVGVLAAGVLPQGSTAHALPPICPDGGPPPCDDDDPEPPPDDPPPTTQPPNPNAGWRSRISILDQSEDGYLADLRGAWVSTGSPVYTTPAASVVWDNPNHNKGRIQIPHPNISVAPLEGFHLWENSQQVDGSMCRSTPIADVPLIFTTTHVLVAESETVGQADLAALGDGFVGDASTPEAEIRLDEVSIEAIDGALHLVLEGWMFADGPLWFNAEGDFRYTADINLLPSEKSEVERLVATSVDTDSLVIFGEDADIEAQVLPKFRKAVLEKVEAAVAAQAFARPQVQWFASLGFTLSFRDVSIDPAGVHVLPSLCKVA